MGIHLWTEFNVFLMSVLCKPGLRLHAYFSLFLTFKCALLAWHINNDAFLFPKQWQVRGEWIIRRRKNAIWV